MAVFFNAAVERAGLVEHRRVAAVVVHLREGIYGEGYGVELLLVFQHPVTGIETPVTASELPVYEVFAYDVKRPVRHRSAVEAGLCRSCRGPEYPCIQYASLRAVRQSVAASVDASYEAAVAVRHALLPEGEYIVAQFLLHFAAQAFGYDVVGYAAHKLVESIAACPGDMRGEQQPFRTPAVQQGIVRRQGFGGEYVHCGPVYASFADCLGKGGLVDYASARHIHQYGLRLHQPQFPASYEIAGTRVQGTVHADHVAAGEQLVQADARVVAAMRGTGGRVPYHFHPEGLCDLRDTAAYIPETYDAYGPAGEHAERRGDLGEEAAAAVVPALDVAVETAAVAYQSEQLGESYLHHRVRRVAGHVAHRNSSAPRCFQVYVVHSGGRFAEQLQLRSPGQQFVGDSDLVDYQHFGIRYPLQRLFRS